MRSRHVQQSRKALALQVNYGLARATLCVAMLILTVQLFCMAFHRHALVERASDCVSCYSASQLTGGVNVAALPVPAATVVVYRQLLSPVVSRFVLVESFRTPFAHAPPVIS